MIFDPFQDEGAKSQQEARLKETPPSGLAQQSADTRPRLSPADIAEAAEAHFKQEVLQISAPGGELRASVRVAFANATVIATQRPEARGFDMEVNVLQRLSAVGAPVPRYLGQRNGVLFQEDAGRARLSVQLATLPAERRLEIAEAAFESLWELKAKAAETGLEAELPILAMNQAWLTLFCNMPATLSKSLGVPVPALDIEGLGRIVVQTPKSFVKWDARPGNAALSADGRVLWFDWEHAGRRAGPEDFAFLAGDEFWPLGAELTLGLFTRTAPQASKAGFQQTLRFLTCFTTLQIVQRMDLIRQRLHRKGWADAKTALRYDRVGATPNILRKLALRGSDWASRDPVLKPLEAWFPQAADAMLQQFKA